MAWTQSRQLLTAVAATLGLLVGLLAGVFAEQELPGYIPVLSGANQGQLNQSEINQTLNVLRANYVNPNFNYGTLTQSSLKGLVDGLGDPHSEYLTPSEYLSEQKGIAGTFTGIGVYLDFNGSYPVVIGTLAGSPARKDGVQAKDVIEQINGKNAFGLKADATAAVIEGPTGTSVTLLLERGTSQITVRVVRAQVNLPEVASTHLPNGVFYIRIYTFASTTTAQFDQQLTAGLPGSTGVVLDLRQNLGGLIDSAAAVISRFVSSGEAFSLRERGGGVQKTMVSGAHPAAPVPLVVLVDADTASAAEITSGSLRDNRHALLIGTQTYGKGSVQQDFPVGGGADVHLTIAKWYLPDGSNIDGKGLTPDRLVDLPGPNTMFDVQSLAAGYASDTQLNRALSIMAGGSGA